ncbi:hypothetical protein CEXT_225131 [Caerostris extrusa]|uniref:Uncharacterized protein n=1 Tax=Caerostris extrusa TaxID=172846 RepID=A0AAV4N2I6_CAEEX|nr:hypothetical protein CEXT_225131 [Caerostris extrusa]
MALLNPKHFVPQREASGAAEVLDKPNFQAACKFQRAMQQFCLHLLTGYRECYFRTKRCLSCMLCSDYVGRNSKFQIFG